MEAVGPPPCSIFWVFEPPAAPEGTGREKGRGPGAPHAPETPPHTRRGVWRAARGLQPLHPCGSRWFLSVSLGAVVGFLLLFLPHGCRRGSWLSRRWFYFYVGTREAGGAPPPQQYFLITCQKTKKQNKMQRGSPVLPSPCLGPGALDALLHSFSTAISLPGPAQGHAIVVFFILISHFKMRNKRIFNEPSQQACVCFILVSGDGGSPQGLLVSLPASAPPPQGGEGKGGQEGGTLQCLQSQARASL